MPDIIPVYPASNPRPFCIPITFDGANRSYHYYLPIPSLESEGDSTFCVPPGFPTYVAYFPPYE